MKLICGIGNPGKSYEKTKHNIGFIVLDNCFDAVKWQSKFSSLCYETLINNEKVLFMKPQTYINLSGIAVGKAASFYNIDSKDIMIIHDDLDMPFGKIKIKFNSSSGGHNGMKSIIENLGTQAFYQFKIGIDNNKKIIGKDYVLSKLSKKEITELNDCSETFKDIIEMFINNKIVDSMNKYN